MSRWRIIGLAGGVAAVVAVLVLVFSGGDASHAVPEGGSSFRTPTSAHRPTPGTGLLDALAPVLDQGQEPAPATSAAPAGTEMTPGVAPDKPSGGLPTTPARAAARLFLVGFGGHDPGRPVLKRLGLHEWGGVVLEPGNGVSPQQVAGLVGSIRGAAQRARHLAPLIAASQLGGQLDAVPIGSPAQSQIPDARTAQASALAAAKVLRTLGIRMVLAPAADIGVAGGPWAGLAYSDDPAAVSALAAAAVAGFKQGQVAPAPGHFPGEGGASGDPVLEQATVGLSLDELRKADLRPFTALAKHAPAIQLSAASFLAFDGVTPATLLPEVVALLRDDLGFKGVVVSGDLQAASLGTGEPVTDLAVQAIKAGCDLVWIPGDATDQDAAWRAVVRALRTGEIPAARAAEALRRVSLLRAQYGVR
jgi:beta-N-acetylhexosaminidase